LAGKKIPVIENHGVSVAHKAFSEDGRYILAEDKCPVYDSKLSTFKLWDAVSGKLICIFQRARKYDGKVNIGRNSVLRKFMPLYRKYEAFWRNALYPQEQFPPISLAYSPDNKYVLIGLTLWDAASERKMASFYKGWLNDLSFTPDGKYALTGNKSHLTLWDMSSGKKIRSYEAHPHEKCWWVNISPDGKYVMSASTVACASALRLWDAASGEEISAFRPFNAASGEEINTFRPIRNDALLGSPAFSPDGKYALVGMNNGVLVLWEMASGKQIRSFEGYSRDANAMAFSPGGRYALSKVSQADSMELWDMASGKEIRSFGAISAWNVQFSPDGRYILSDFKRGMSLWCVSSGKEICSFYAFTDEEWVMVTPEGFYNASPDGHKYLSIRTGDDIQRIEVCRETFYRPDMVRKSLESAESFEGPDTEDIAVPPEADASSESDPPDILILDGDDEETCSSSEMSQDEAGGFDDAEKPEIFLRIKNTDKIESRLTCAALTPDNKYALSGGLDGKVRLWKVDSGKLIRSFSVYGSTDITSLALSPDGKYVLAGSKDIRLWELYSGRSAFGSDVRSFSNKKRCDALEFSRDGQYALTATKGELNLYETGSWQKIRTFEGYSGVSATLSPDGKYILSGGKDATMTLWNVYSGKDIRSFRGEEYPCNDHGNVHVHIRSVAFSPDGKYGLAGGDESVSRLWELASGRLIRTFNTGIVKSLAFSPDGRHALSGGRNHPLKLWDIFSGKQIRSFKGHLNEVSFVTFSADGKYILSASSDRTMKLWDAGSGKTLRTFKEHGLSLSAAGFSPDGRYALAGYDDTTLMLWDIVSGKGIRTFRGHIEPIESVIFSPDSKYALSAGKDAAMKVWEVDSGKQTRSFNEYFEVVDGVVSPGGKYALTGLRLWDTDSGKPIKMKAIEEKAGRSSVHPLTFSPDGKYALIKIDGTVWLWDVISDKEIRSFKDHILCAAFSSDGKYILSGNYDTPPKLWKTNSGKAIRKFSGHSDRVSSLTFSPDDKYVLSKDVDGIRLWNVASGKELLSFREYMRSVVAMGFSHDGKSALSVSAGRHKTIRMWNLASGKEICQFIAFENEQWVVLTSQGYYNASPDAHKYLNVRIGKKELGMGRYRKKFYRPDKVREILSGSGKSPFQEKPGAKAHIPKFGEYESRKYKVKKYRAGNTPYFWKIYDRKTDREILFYGFSGEKASCCDRDYGENDLRIKHCCISPDDKYVLFSIGGVPIIERVGVFHVYNIETGREYDHKFESSQNRGIYGDIKELAFSDDGKFIRISYYGYDADVIWNFETGKIAEVVEKNDSV